jgi:MFS family permease
VVPTTRARQRALAALLLITGLAMGSWITRTPAIRDLLDASTSQMGLILFAMSAGSMVGILCSGPLVSRYGTRPVIAVGMAGELLCMPTVGLGAGLASDRAAQLVVAAGLLLFGLGMGTAEVAINVEGATVEKLTLRPFLLTMHGFFSLGASISAAAGIAFTILGVNVGVHLTAVGVLAAGGVVAALRGIPRGSGTTDRPPEHMHGPTTGGGRVPLWRDRRLVLIGFVVFAMALTEGTASDWLPLIMVDGHGLDAALSSAVYAIFAATMAVGRLTGGHVVRRFGRAKVVAVSAALAAGGMGLVAAVDTLPVVSVAVLLWAVGAALGFPLAISAAGDSGPDATARVSLAASLGFLAFLVGPPVLGFIGEHVGLRTALVVPVVMMSVVLVVARVTDDDATRRRRASADDPPPEDRDVTARVDMDAL